MPDRTLYTRLRLDQKGYQSGVNKAKKQTSGLNKTVKKLGATIGVAFAAKKIAGFVNETANLGDQIGKLSKQTGVGTEALQKYQFAAERTGVSKEKLNSSLERFQKRVGMAQTGTGSLANQLKNLNPELLKNVKNADNTNQAFRKYMDAMGDVPNKSKQAAMAQAAFGREGLKLINMAEGGTDAIDKYGDKLEETGGILSKDLVKASEDYQDRMENMKMAIRGVKAILAKNLMPIFKKVMKNLQTFAKWVKDNIDAIKSWGKTIGIAVGAFIGSKGLLKVIKMGRSAVMGLRTGFRGLNATMKANIIFAIASALLALYQRIKQAWQESAKFRAIVKYVWESVKYYFTAVKEWVIMVAKSVWDGVKTYFMALPKIAKTVWDSIKAVFGEGDPGKILKEGLTDVKDSFANIGKEAKEEFKAKMEETGKPDYEKIIEKEKAKQKAKETGEEAGKTAGEAYNRKMNETIKKGKKPPMPEKPSEDISMPSMKGGEEEEGDLTIP
nr:hypothetical protein [Candidatus Cloacimonadota bacterium]